MAYTTAFNNGNVITVIFDGEASTAGGAAQQLGTAVNTWLAVEVPAPDPATIILSQANCVYDITTATFVFTAVGTYSIQ